MIDDAYASFKPFLLSHRWFKQVGNNWMDTWVISCPTLAFKDFAYTAIGRFDDYFLSERKKSLWFFGANVGGDTDSAAYEGLPSLWATLIILFCIPYSACIEVQRRQMTTSIDDNVFNIAVKRAKLAFDCKYGENPAFAWSVFLESAKLGAVNSIMGAYYAQIVYLFFVALSVGAPHP